MNFIIDYTCIEPLPINFEKVIWFKCADYTYDKEDEVEYIIMFMFEKDMQAWKYNDKTNRDRVYNELLMLVGSVKL